MVGVMRAFLTTPLSHLESALALLIVVLLGAFVGVLYYAPQAAHVSGLV